MSPKYLHEMLSTSKAARELFAHFHGSRRNPCSTPLPDARCPAAGWQTFTAPRDMDTLGAGWQGADGEAVFRREIQVPRAMARQDLTLSLGTLDDFDSTFFNGVRVGGVGKENAAAYSVKREYLVPARLVKPGRNVIAIRVWDRFGGGFTTEPK